MRFAIIASAIFLVGSNLVSATTSDDTSLDGIMSATCFAFATDIQNMNFNPPPIQSYTGLSSCANWNDEGYEATIAFLKETGMSPKEYIGY
jgi:hypothetical protein